MSVCTGEIDVHRWHVSPGSFSLCKVSPSGFGDSADGTGPAGTPSPPGVALRPLDTGADSHVLRKYPRGHLRGCSCNSLGSVLLLQFLGL